VFLGGGVFWCFLGGVGGDGREEATRKKKNTATWGRSKKNGKVKCTIKWTKPHHKAENTGPRVKGKRKTGEGRKGTNLKHTESNTDRQQNAFSKRRETPKLQKKSLEQKRNKKKGHRVNFDRRCGPKTERRKGQIPFDRTQVRARKKVPEG